MKTAAERRRLKSSSDTDVNAASLVHEAFENQVLEKDLHAALLKAAGKVAQDAAIPEYMLYRSMTEFCSQEEVAYIRGLRQHSLRGICGLVIVGKKASVPVSDRMMAMAAACLRNYISARLMTLQEVLDGLKGGDLPSPKVALIPNFFVGKADGGVVADWEIAPLMGWLYRRQADSQQTVLYVQSLEALEQAYGSSMARLLKKHYVNVVTK
jgi:hypothetical protein